jgi:hypothetical protein
MTDDDVAKFLTDLARPDKVAKMQTLGPNYTVDININLSVRPATLASKSGHM